MNALGARSRRAWRGDLLDALYVGVESVTWFMLLRVFTTLGERAFLDSLAERVRMANSAAEIADRASIERALIAIEAARQVAHGPSWVLVAFAAAGGFLLVRGTTRLGLEGAAGALVLLFATVLGLNVVAHLAIAGDLRLWDTSRVAGILSNPNQYFSERLDLKAFLADPILNGTSGAAITVTMLGLVLVWFRFAIAGRRAVTVERVAHSFGGGFAFALVAMAIAAASDVGGLAPWAVLQFVGGVLALAVANHVRATAPSEGPVRPGPWLVAVGGTIGMLVVMSALLGLAVLLNVAVVLDAVGGVALRVVEIVLIVIITPLYWVMNFLLHLLLPKGITNIFENLARIGLNMDQLRDEQHRGNGGLPGWVSNGAKFIAALAIAWVMYRVASFMLARRSRGEGPVAEVRGAASSSGGLGAFLRDLFPRGRRRLRDGWERRHPAYLLWRRAERDGEERGFARLPGETTLEFAGRAEQLMDAPFPGVAGVFDRLRYGRHEPASAALMALDESLTAWETATPATAELRERLAGASPLPPDRDFALRVESAKRIARGRPAPGEERPDRPPDLPF